MTRLEFEPWLPASELEPWLALLGLEQWLTDSAEFENFGSTQARTVGSSAESPMAGPWVSPAFCAEVFEISTLCPSDLELFPIPDGTTMTGEILLDGLTATSEATTSTGDP